MKTLKMCLNWKVLAGLIAAGVGLYFLAPELALAALPILVLAVCPLSMMLMMWSMRGTEDKESGLASEERLASLREQQMALDKKIDALERTRSAENTGARSDARG
ncbi:DUF2933 domain-containing protein [Rubrobacter indicoceani]|uniref:DUF2933 domain-containing protein n=1 Tax=Rubrobacter indicoceani TaxID=2051957 RepID=UPI0013C4E135|nr:DUF2933 domain-containing protein [Rubrobacter indicoceani]